MILKNGSFSDRPLFGVENKENGNQFRNTCTLVLFFVHLIYKHLTTHTFLSRSIVVNHEFHSYTVHHFVEVNSMLAPFLQFQMSFKGQVG